MDFDIQGHGRHFSPVTNDIIIQCPFLGSVHNKPRIMSALSYTPLGRYRKEMTGIQYPFTHTNDTRSTLGSCG